MAQRIEIRRAVYAANDEAARRIHEELARRSIFCVNILGSPGAGKTSLILRLAEALAQRAGGNGRMGSGGPEKVAGQVRDLQPGLIPSLRVIEGDVAGDLDTRLLRERGIEAWNIETGGDCHLNAAMMADIIPRMDLPDGAWLLVENIGNLVCPADFSIGEDIKLVVASAAEGSDKPYKYPGAFARSAACILTKLDIATAVGFDQAFFESGYRSLAPSAPLFALDGRSGRGAQAIVEFLERVAKDAGQ